MNIIVEVYIFICLLNSDEYEDVEFQDVRFVMIFRSNFGIINLGDKILIGIVQNGFMYFYIVFIVIVFFDCLVEFFLFQFF